jgi:intracellular sulfur oxidation DsrE/DsrF family protein
MTQENKFSQEFLNAFVDDQLTAEEKSHAYPFINQDDTLNRAVCELRKTRDLVQLAYKDVPAPPSRTRPTRGPGYLGLSVAAGVALLVGISVGWVLHEPPHAGEKHATGVGETNKKLPSTVVPDALPATATTAKPGSRPEVARTAVPTNAVKVGRAGDMPRVIIHVSHADAARLGQALDEIEQLVQHYRANRQTARIEVIMNGEGLALVRADVTPYAARVERMQQEYDNLAFVACQNTIDRLKHEKGITAQLLPGVSVIDSGVAQLMRRQHQGWAYIQV